MVNDPSMALPYSPRRRKQAIASAVLILGLFCLLGHYLLVQQTPLISAHGSLCVETLANLEQQAVSWPGIATHAGPIGSDVIDSVKLLDDFERCVLRNGNLKGQQINAIEAKLFPYLNLETLEANEKNFWPPRIRWNGDLLRGSVPRFASTGDYKYLGAAKSKYNKNLSFWGNWLDLLSKSSSKGIVISVGAGQISDATKLIKVLRYQMNALPIEIIHRGDLSEDQQQLLIQAARSAHSASYPAQELWFVNVSNVLNPRHAEQFATYSNKWLAIIFSSFESPILVDADTIPFISLEKYYDFQQYKEMGLLFFKDRAITSDLLNKEQLNTLKQIALSTIKLGSAAADLNNAIELGIKDNIAAETVMSMLVEGQKHHMESGLVLMDKSLHLVNLLTSVSLQFSSISSYFHGDKEWFWIAYLLRNRPFTFHPKQASNVGKLGRVQSEDGKEFYQICSVQVSHTELDGSLLWINGGLKTCKKNSWTSDYASNKRISSMFNNEEEVRNYYQSPVSLEGAIIPSVDKAPWIYTGECAMFSYCTLYKEGEYGELSKFSEPQREAYEEVVKIWNSDS